MLIKPYLYYTYMYTGCNQFGLWENRCITLYLQELTNKHAEKKQAYDTAAAGLESNMAKLEQVGSVTDGFVPNHLVSLLIQQCSFVAETVPSSTGFLVLGQP